MIKIYDKLWYIVNPSRAEKEDNLAYMTYWENNEAFRKRKETGTSWARNEKYNYQTREYEGEEVGEGEIIDNTPVKGVYIGSSVSRWSTSNKLFRVKDPRGFTVEVPTDNISTLLHLTTVINGLIQEECVWAREGNNHILLPVNSEPYLETIGKMDLISNGLIKLSDLKSGDAVKLFEDESKYVYLGKGKVTWTISPYDYVFVKGRWVHEPIGTSYEHTSSGYLNIFKIKHSWGKEGNFSYRNLTNPKITEVVSNTFIDLSVEPIDLWVTGKPKDIHYESKIKEIKWK